MTHIASKEEDLVFDILEAAQLRLQNTLQETTNKAAAARAVRSVCASLEDTADLSTHKHEIGIRIVLAGLRRSVNISTPVGVTHRYVLTAIKTLNALEV